METKAIARFVRLSSQKARLVMNQVRGKNVGEARKILMFAPQKAAQAVKNVIDSAVANAEHNNNADIDNLYIKRIYSDEGPIMKRWRPRAQGRAGRIQKRTSHLTVVLEEL